VNRGQTGREVTTEPEEEADSHVIALTQALEDGVKGAKAGKRGGRESRGRERQSA
jgi:hypothetical protein